MKELSVEEKAKRYNEALSRAKEICATLSDKAMSEYIFPELKESEDERIRKAIVATIHLYYGEYLEDEAKEMIAWLEKQGEQKPIDKVEPKSNIEKGKWYVCDISRYTDFVVGKAYFCPKNGMLKPNENEIARYVAKDCFHLWTIQDAKEGDVLCCENGWTCIFRVLNSDISFSSYCFMDDTGWFCEIGSESHTLDKAFIKAYNGNIHPATKEQRDNLMNAIADAGYTFDFEKKELKKIEKKPTDEEMKEALRTEYEKGRADAISEMEKPTWSVEDMSKVQRICKYLDEAKKYYADITEVRECTNWLKSLKDRCTWKPSDVQIKALHDLNLTGNISYAGQGQVLIELYNDLKKLAEE